MRDIVLWVDYTAKIEAIASVNIRAQVGGYLKSINFKEGENVKKGDLLFVIDPRPYEAALASAEAELAEAKARVELAKTNLERAKELYAADVVAKELLDTRNCEMLSSNAVLASAEAKVRNAKLNLEYTSIRAPMSGKISEALVDIGNLIVADSTLLTRIVDDSSVQAYFELSERDVVAYRDCGLFNKIDIKAGTGPTVSLRSDLRDIYNLKVPNIRGNNVPLGSVAKINRIIGPSRVSRFNLYPCAEIIGALERGHSTGEAIAEIEKIASEVLPDGMGIEWTDLAFQEKRMGNTSIYIFALCVIFVYLMLVALYEDWKLPLSVILVVPLVLLFAIAAVLARNLDNNLMTQVGFIVLIGLACKNAILIVEFAKIRQEHGEDAASAVSSASRNRLRPILMTSFAFILGVVPLAYGVDAGAELREALGTSVLYGMIGVTFLGLIFTPAFYYAIQRNKKYAVKDTE